MAKILVMTKKKKEKVFAYLSVGFRSQKKKTQMVTPGAGRSLPPQRRRWLKGRVQMRSTGSVKQSIELLLELT